jgi:RNA polymerase sigma-70 factor (ECF subfamily)
MGNWQLINAQKLDEASDEDLMLRVASGDKVAFQCLARRHSKSTFALARRIAGNDEDAEEIVQEALIRVWTAAPRWRPDAAFKTWLYRIAVNLCLNLRRQKPLVALEEAGDRPDPEPLAIDLLERKQSDKFVANAIAWLPERQRAVLVLTYYEGLSNAETADMMDTSVSSVESLLVRAKRTLRARLGDMLGVKIEDRRLRLLAGL